MGKRSKVITASALLIVAGAVMIMGLIGGGNLQAAGIAETGFDLSKLLVWGGAAVLVISAVLFISASN